MIATIMMHLARNRGHPIAITAGIDFAADYIVVTIDADLHPRLQTFIDDRTDVHGTEITKEYFDIMNAADGWASKLEKHNVNLLCLPDDSPLAKEIGHHRDWTRLCHDDSLVVYRRQDFHLRVPDNAKQLESASERQ